MFTNSIYNDAKVKMSLVKLKWGYQLMRDIMA